MTSIKVNLPVNITLSGDFNVVVEVQDREDQKQELGRIRVADRDGNIGTFFLTMRVKNGKPVLELVAKKKDDKEMKAHVTADWQ